MAKRTVKRRPIKAEPSPWGHTKLQRARLKAQYQEVSLDDLTPWADNPRFNEDAVPKVAKLIKEHGFAGTIVATPDGTIWAGNTRYKALLQLRKEGWEQAETVWVHWRTFDTRKAAEEFALSDNKAGEFADWDHAKLAKMFKSRRKIEVAELEKVTGFSQLEIDGFVRPKKVYDEKDVDESMAEVKCPECGNHFIPKWGK
ncbi:MAG: ParB N-terminal domain-containing protein [Deltaproteobacteria bacterium]|nr:ParB N-terminal domain-containing protein [Deltaproteobacteria bacterium]